MYPRGESPKSRNRHHEQQRRHTSRTVAAASLPRKKGNERTGHGVSTPLLLPRRKWPLCYLGSLAVHACPRALHETAVVTMAPRVLPVPFPPPPFLPNLPPPVPLCVSVLAAATCRTAGDGRSLGGRAVPELAMTQRPDRRQWQLAHREGYVKLRGERPMERQTHIYMHR